MAVKILLKNDNGPGNIPGLGDLDLGEASINSYDGKMFIKKDNGTATIIEIGELPTTKNVTEEFTATSGQTVYATTGFTATANVQVFQNGILLGTSEYALATPNVTLGTGAVTSDLISIRILDLGV